MKRKIVVRIYLKNGRVLRETIKVKKSDMPLVVSSLEHISHNIGDSTLSPFCIGYTSVCQTEVAAIVIKQKGSTQTVEKIS